MVKNEEYRSLKVDIAKEQFDVKTEGAVSVSTEFEIPSLNSKIKLNIDFRKVFIDLDVGVLVRKKIFPSKSV